MTMTDEQRTIARLEREARETCLGRLGNRDGVNVARVEVYWCFEDQGSDYGPAGVMRRSEHAGHFLVHATGDEPGAETIYETFEELVAEAMNERKRRQGFADWEITDTYAA